jgi:hypothetical protein
LNGYLKKRQDINQGFLDAGEQMGMQKMWDYIQVTLSDPEVMKKDTFGKKRIKKIFNHIKKLADRYHICFTDDKEADYYQEKLDAQLRKGCDEFYPFYERYPQLKKLGYNKARKGWR